MSISVRIQDPRDCWSPDERMEVVVEWSSVDPVDEVEIRLLWVISGRGDEEEGAVATERIENPGTSSRHQLEFRLPRGPWSFDGELVTINWFVDAVLWPSGEQTQTEFTLSPTGAPLVPLVDATEDLLSQLPEGGRAQQFVRWIEAKTQTARKK